MKMDHERAIERTQEIAILYRTRSADPYRVRRGDALDCEALETLLADCKAYGIECNHLRMACDGLVERIRILERSMPQPEEEDEDEVE